MTAELPNPRYERKFVARGCTLPDVLALVRRHPAAFREAYPSRLVNNVYFDTPSLRDYHVHVNGACERSKTRLRWYGHTNSEPLAALFERKMKRGFLSGKAAVPSPPIVLSTPGAVLWQTVFGNPEIPEAWRFSLRGLHASLFNSYRRSYFISADGRFRLTVDFDLRFSPPQSLNGSFASSCSFPPILELKYRPEHADIAQTVASQFPVRLCRCSKYILGIEQLARH